MSILGEQIAKMQEYCEAAALGIPRAPNSGMDEKDFKKHLQDLAHGHHHPEEHDWDEGKGASAKAARPTKKAAAAKTKRSK